MQSSMVRVLSLLAMVGGACGCVVADRLEVGERVEGELDRRRVEEEFDKLADDFRAHYTPPEDGDDDDDGPPDHGAPSPALPPPPAPSVPPPVGRKLTQEEFEQIKAQILAEEAERRKALRKARGEGRRAARGESVKRELARQDREASAA